MNTRISRFREVVHSSFRLTVGILATLLVLWACVMDLVAVVVHPYLIAALWLVGMVALFGCASAYLNTFPNPDQGKGVPHPVRALACLAGEAAMGWVLWTQARPALAGEPLGLEFVGFALGGALILGLALLALLVMMVFLGEAESEEVNLAAQGVGDFISQETVA
jgi:hypothetical protein